MNTSEVLNKAADLIERRGWTVGASGFDWGLGGSDPVCVEGAIYAVLGGVGASGEMLESGGINACPAGAAVRSYLQLDKPIWMWNDGHVDLTPTSTAVIEVLRAAAVIEAAREDQDAAWATYAEVVAS